MEAEFVNIFVEKQREAIVDLTARNIMLEARLTFATKTAEQTTQQSEESLAYFQKSLEEAQALTVAVKEEARRDISLLQQTVTERDKELAHLKVKVKDQGIEIDTMKATVKQLTIEQEIQMAKTTRLKSKAKQLAEE